METFAWRYHPEFVISILTDGQTARSVEVLPSTATLKTLNDRGFIARTNGGVLTCFGRRLLNGADWVPAYEITHPLSFSFWLRSLPGNTVFYADNLSSTGEIDAGLVNNRLNLIHDPDVQDPAIPDQAAVIAGAQGVVTIYKDTWSAPAAPIEYRINLNT